MRYGSVCSGIEAATSAWHTLGWKAAWLSEIEPFPSAVLAHHYPNVPNFGDMTKFKEWTLNDSTAIDVLVGGTPCQSFSVAGLRKGLDDPRGNLMLTYLAIARKYRPKWLVWENVPGVLSSAGGEDFASLLRGMGECGYGFAYRILDAQHFGVPQRRRRVFVVGCLGDWRAAAAVLFERHSLQGHPAPSREKRQEVAGTIAARFKISRNNHEECVAWPAKVAPTLDAHYGDKMGLENQHINGGGGCLSVAKCLITKTRLDAETETLIPTFGGHFSCDPIALAENTIGRQPMNGGNGNGFTVAGPMYTLNATGVHGVAQPYSIMPMNSGKDYKARPTEISQPLMAGGPVGGNQGGDFILQPIPIHDQATYVAHSIACDVADTLSVGANQTTGFIGDVVAQAIPLDLRNAGRDPEKHDAVNRQGVGVGEAGDPAHTVTSAFVHGVAQPMVLMDQGESVMNVMEDGTVGTLRRETHGHEPVVMQPMAFSGQMSQPQVDSNMTPTLGAKNPMAVSTGMAVRRLTCVECERLQGFPDNYTNIPWRGKPESPDGPRYKALGNSMAVPVMRWIGERIEMVNQINKGQL